jgi:hypothetical protein
MPTDDGLQKARKFKGMLIAGAREVSLSFDAHISDAGEIVLELEQIPLTRETTFIVETWHRGMAVVAARGHKKRSPNISTNFGRQTAVCRAAIPCAVRIHQLLTSSRIN